MKRRPSPVTHIRIAAPGALLTLVAPSLTSPSLAPSLSAQASNTSAEAPPAVCAEPITQKTYDEAVATA